jgi:hypothetical protein
MSVERFDEKTQKLYRNIHAGGGGFDSSGHTFDSLPWSFGFLLYLIALAILAALACLIWQVLAWIIRLCCK